MTKGQAKLFKQIERGVKAGASTVIETAERTNTKIVIAGPDGEIKKLTPKQAIKVLAKSEADSTNN